ncbi:MAG: hypothetical protein BWZ02_01664 [Lentisphaerae bacterium ADurb.BinA184]|nr:MAG: hypothetical protein BWZ02_01664 [Lentisphaerae bacterium ADurb.BinA184]
METCERRVPRVADFTLDGGGTAAAWRQAAWTPLTRVNGDAPYATRAKVLASNAGVYFLVECDDQRLTCTITGDSQNIFTEDVVEVFLWPDQRRDLYFEYEISPLNAELCILVPNHGGRFHGWLPWHYEGERRTRHATSVRGGPHQALATVTGWTAEFFIPFALLVPLENTPPAPGARWRANLYRIDYDTGAATQWAWCPHTGANFHAFRQFGTFIFD